MPTRTTARMAAFIPGASPPLVRTAMCFKFFLLNRATWDNIHVQLPVVNITQGRKKRALGPAQNTLLADQVFKFTTGFEFGIGRGGNGNGFTRLRITSFAGLPFRFGESSKTNELHIVTLFYAGFDRV